MEPALQLCSPHAPFASNRHLHVVGAPQTCFYVEPVTDKLGRRVTAKGNRSCSSCTGPTGCVSSC